MGSFLYYGVLGEVETYIELIVGGYWYQVLGIIVFLLVAAVDIDTECYKEKKKAYCEA